MRPARPARRPAPDLRGARPAGGCGPSRPGRQCAGRQCAGRQRRGRQRAGRQRAGRQCAGRQCAGRQRRGRQRAGPGRSVRQGDRTVDRSPDRPGLRSCGQQDDPPGCPTPDRRSPRARGRSCPRSAAGPPPLDPPGRAARACRALPRGGSVRPGRLPTTPRPTSPRPTPPPRWVQLSEPHHRPAAERVPRGTIRTYVLGICLSQVCRSDAVFGAADEASQGVGVGGDGLLEQAVEQQAA